jgi:glycerol-3-phosphate acyltransferase PlsX
VFDYERVGGSVLLGVKGTVIITHGRAKRRMIGYGVGVAATMARTRVPELIGEALRPSPGMADPGAPTATSTATSTATPASAALESAS